jgi:hypothetical protein
MNGLIAYGEETWKAVPPSIKSINHLDIMFDCAHLDMPYADRNPANEHVFRQIIIWNKINGFCVNAPTHPNNKYLVVRMFNDAIMLKLKIPLYKYLTAPKKYKQKKLNLLKTAFYLEMIKAHNHSIVMKYAL